MSSRPLPLLPKTPPRVRGSLDAEDNEGVETDQNHSQPQPQSPSHVQREKSSTSKSFEQRQHDPPRRHHDDSESSRPGHRRLKSQSQSHTTSQSTSTSTRSPPNITLHNQQQQNTPKKVHNNDSGNDDKYSTEYFDVDNSEEMSSPSLQHFSPSKARAVAQQSQQLAILTRWMSPLLSLDTTTTNTTTIDDSSSNVVLNKWISEHQSLRITNPNLAADMVRWLEETMYVNRSADETRRLVYEAQREELESIIANTAAAATAASMDGKDDGVGKRNRIPTATARLLDKIYSSLTDPAKEALDSLAETSVLLGHLLNPSPSLHPGIDDDDTAAVVVGIGREGGEQSSLSFGQELGHAIIDYTLYIQDLETQMEDLQRLQHDMSEQLAQIQKQQEAFELKRQMAVKDAEVMLPQTAQWNRETKQIAIKIKEYKDRVATLERSRPGFEGGKQGEQNLIRIEDVVDRQRRIKEKKDIVGKLEESIKSLNGLPPDLEASREEVKRAKLELEYQKARREELFAAMANR